MAARPTAAVLVERAYKHYGSPNKSNYKSVLDNLNMVVERGHIYGLLGPSGCGKTTLLSCIVGRRKLNSGNIWVLGGKPGEKGSGVPGSRVGYMPQDIALVGEFTVKDAVYFFGRIYGMPNDKLEERFKFLSDLLELSSASRLVKTLSGGQQRRVSFAASLVHEPELLILDEPTVGLDPVLRDRIWDFLVEIARGGTAVIITTHYIDETRQANKIGLLRDGQLLAEEAPADLLRKFDCETLEDAFYKLALRQQSRRRSTLTPDVVPEPAVSDAGAAAESPYESREDFTVVTSSTDVLTPRREKPYRYVSDYKSRYKAVFIKSIQQFARNPGGLVFAVLFPIIQVVAFFSAIGHDPRDLQVAVVNEEAIYSPLGLDICHNKSVQFIEIQEDERCQQYMTSCWFLEEMAKKDLDPLYYESADEAKEAVKNGKVYGALHFSRNFSDALSNRIQDSDMADDDVDDSNIDVWLDMSNHNIANFIKVQLLKAYKSFTKRTMKACGKDTRLGQIPAVFHDPVYGKKDPEVVAFMAPGVMITIVFFLSAIVTSTLMIGDRLEGIWERSAVAGVKAREMLNVHIVIQSCVILVQTAEMMFLAWGPYNLPSKGSVIAIGVLLYLQGLSGMCYGFLLSIYCNSYSLSFFVATGSFYPMILLCGIMWPLEAMTGGLRILALTLPFTIPATALRDIMQKGASILEPTVYQGFLVTIAWIIVTLALCLLRLKYRKN
ncbi:ABC transporter G family member 23 [Amyelois transitella]|uniref:ABC transporter G family member 23 n=1 Tax=Amyelois transitella TaxID=680683 RepID=UPI00298F3F19|nr:ABC transporter G family member 23 [Amyelois transitella]XP_060806918.1 ABC transporter G family member 23 [Amyelois transitella]